MSSQIFIPIVNDRVFLVYDSHYELRDEVKNWLQETAYPFYMCRVQKPSVSQYGDTRWNSPPIGEFFHFSKPSAAAMFKLAWGGK